MKKLLWMGDDPRSKSGYGRVLKEMLPYLKEMYEVFILSIGYKGPGENIIDSNDGTSFGFKSVVKVFNQIEPDIFILLNDHKIIWGWLCELKKHCNISHCKIIPYVCTEYIGIPKNDMIIYNETCEHILVMANFTGEEMKRQGCHIPYTRVSHGYPETLKKLDKKLSRKLLGISENSFVFYSGNRNQPRKRLDIIIRAYVEFLKGEDKNTILMMNCGLIDMGINIPELYERLCFDNGLINWESKIHYCNKTNEPSRYNDDDLSIIYSCCDVGITTSTGESFGLVPFEMSLFDVPQIIPNFGGIIESIKNGSIHVNIADYYSYPRVIQSAGGIGAIVHFKDVAQAMGLYYSDNDLYDTHCNTVKLNLIGNSWKEVSKQCICILENEIKNEKHIKNEYDLVKNNIQNFDDDMNKETGVSEQCIIDSDMVDSEYVSIEDNFKVPSNKLITEYDSLLKKYNFIFDKMKYFLKQTGEILEGCCMYENDKSECIEDQYAFTKQLNLYELAKNADNILEIGFNMGNSALLYLISNNYSKIVCFDICHHKYTRLSFEYLNQLFPNRLILIEGDSTKTIPSFYEDKYNNFFDLVHIDGGHHIDIANQDFINTYHMANNLIIFDDDWLDHINNLCNRYIKLGFVKEYYHYKTIKYTHKLLIKVDKEPVKNLKIPKIIHQIWIGPNPCPYQLLNTWKKNHPDWEYILWTEEKLKNEDFINKHLIDNINIIVCKTDLIRYELLYKYGGVYMDADIICKKKIDDCFLEDDLFATYYDKKHTYITNSTIGSIKNHYLLKELIEDFNKLNLTNLIINDPVEFSGVPFSDKLKSSDANIYDYYYFNPIDFQNINDTQINNSKVYGVHFWGTTRSNMTNKKINIYNENISLLNEKIIGKKNIYICTHDIKDLISGNIITKGYWEPHITIKFIKILKNLDKNDIIIDVGANLGYYSLIGCAYGFEVIAFEPFEQNYNKFHASIILNSFHHKIKLYKKIVWKNNIDKKSLIIVPGPIVNFGCIAVSDDGNKALPINLELGNNPKFRTISLDSLNIKKHIGLLKIDVEGSEFEVIQGALDLIKKNYIKNIIIEFSLKFRNIEIYHMIAKFLVLNSYFIYDFNDNRYSYEEYINDISKYEQKDYLFIKSDFIPIQCIHLRNNIERKKHMDKQIIKHNLKYKLIFIEALDGKLIDYKNFNLISDFAKGKLLSKNKEHGHDMTMGASGLIHTTFDIWNSISNNNLIVEDDIIFEENFEDNLKITMRNLPKDWDIFYAGYHNDPRITHVKDNVYMGNKVYGCFGYIINPNSIKNLINKVFPCDYQIDTEIHRKNNYKLNNYIMYPSLIKSSGKFKSSIQIFDIDEKTISTNNINKLNTNKIDKYSPQNCQQINTNKYQITT